MKTAVIVPGILVAAVLAVVPSLHASLQYPYEYTYDANGTGCSGALFLDGAMSNGGSLSDIGANSYIDLDGQQILLNNLSLGPSSGAFTWNTSGITSPISIFITVFLERVQANNAQGYVDELEYAAEKISFGSLGAGNNGSGISMYIYDDQSQGGGGWYSGSGPSSAGQWVGAPVPEPAQLIVGCSLCAVLVGSHFRQKRGQK
jgi:hypothetical protein